ncbi:MAG TPA: ABC transporter substrate-binding protein [Proteobacteria bacterium]|nr:leucine-, isoleucine-, valine-, threonine-, and alanine-binding protein precursor [bacterium BMS3Abin14]HDL53278.1 ABC transporter substrate-binding protein [Pseudomonadota bacterium]
MSRRVLRSRWTICAVAALTTMALGVFGCAKAPEKTVQPILVGGIFDTSGPTSGVGKDYAQGAVDAAEYINAHGGVNGRDIELIANDYGYKIPEAVSLYKTYKDKGVFIIQGWGTGDTNALKEQVNKDKIVYMSASYDSLLNDPAKTPYNFYVGTSYGDAIRGAMQYISDSWTDSVRKPKVVFIYPDHPYGKNPIPAGKAMAEALGFDIGPDQFVPLNAKEATSQLANMKRFNPDWAWIGGTSPSAAVIIKDAAKLGLTTKFIINVWGFDENLTKMAGDAANGRTYGMGPFAMWGADVPGMKAPMEMAKSKNPDAVHTVHYIQSWTSMNVMWEAMKRAKTLDGPGLKAALETLKDFDTGGLTAPITFTATDHRPNTTLNVNMINDEGKIELVKSITLERKPEWLGK